MGFIAAFLVSKRSGSGCDAALVVMDCYTKMARHISCNKEVDAVRLADVIEDEVLKHYGVPDGIVTDRGSIFTNNYWTIVCCHLNIIRRLSTAFHPQTNELTERQNRIVEAYLRAYCNEQRDDWASRLWMAEFA